MGGIYGVGMPYGISENTLEILTLARDK